MQGVFGQDEDQLAGGPDENFAPFIKQKVRFSYFGAGLAPLNNHKVQTPGQDQDQLTAGFCSLK